jgi:(2Fe-2S) ferredoxin
MLKEAVSEKGWKGRVRVSQSGCMGLCGNGPNVMLHPQGVWISEVLMDDVGMIIAKVEEILQTTQGHVAT